MWLMSGQDADPTHGFVTYVKLGLDQMTDTDIGQLRG